MDAPKPPFPWVPVLRLAAVMFLVLPAMFSLTVAPLLAATRNPDSNINRVEILVSSYDAGAINSAFTAFFASVAATSGVNHLPTFAFVSASTDDLLERVRSTDVWAAVWLNANATARYAAALADPSGAGATYDASSIISWVYDEGRNSAVAASRVHGPLTALVSAFSRSFAATRAAQLSRSLTATQLQAVASAAPALLTAPVAGTGTAMYPAAHFPLSTTVLTLGNILMTVFAMAVTTAVIKSFTPMLAAQSRVVLMLARICLLLLLNAAVSATFTTIVVGLGLGALPDPGLVWARMWAVLWLLMLIFSFFFASVAVFFNSADVIAPFLLVSMLFNITGGWNTDLADIGFRAFWYTPFYHATMLMRNVYFGSYPTKVGMNVGVLISWGVVSLAGLIVFSLKPHTRATPAEQAAAAELNAATGAHTAHVADKEAAPQLSPIAEPSPLAVKDEPAVVTVAVVAAAAVSDVEPSPQ